MFSPICQLNPFNSWANTLFHSSGPKLSTLRGATWCSCNIKSAFVKFVRFKSQLNWSFYQLTKCILNYGVFILPIFWDVSIGWTFDKNLQTKMIDWRSDLGGFISLYYQHLPAGSVYHLIQNFLSFCRNILSPFPPELVTK